MRAGEVLDGPSLLRLRFIYLIADMFKNRPIERMLEVNPHDLILAPSDGGIDRADGTDFESKRSTSRQPAKLVKHTAAGFREIQNRHISGDTAACAISALDGDSKSGGSSIIHMERDTRQILRIMQCW